MTREEAGARLWLCDVSSVTDPALLETYQRLLDHAEKERLRRFRFDKDRHVFLVSHALLRATLSRVTGCAPEDLRFGKGAHGKPLLLDTHGQPTASPAFNLSHSGPFAVVAVDERAGAIGVDVEYHRPGRRFDALAVRHFACAERQHLAAQDTTARAACFYDIWTLKEAYIKARGAGLSMPLDEFAFSFTPGAIGFTAEPGLDPAPGRWRFWCARIGGDASLSLAVDPGIGDECFAGPRLFRTVPLGECHPVIVDQTVGQSPSSPPCA